MGYMAPEQALDEVGRCLMPDEWLGTEIALLRDDRFLIEEITAERAAVPDTPVGRLTLALNFLIHALSAGELNAVVVREAGEMRPFPSSLWTSPGGRAVFRSGELPVQLRVALEGHKASAGKRWVLIPGPALHRLLSEAGPAAELPDIETEFRDWLTKRIEQCAKRERISKKQLWMEAQPLFGPRLSYRSFNRIWSATARQSASQS
jgi:hypothetical protein